MLLALVGCRLQFVFFKIQFRLQQYRCVRCGRYFFFFFILEFFKCNSISSLIYVLKSLSSRVMDYDFGYALPSSLIAACANKLTNISQMRFCCVCCSNFPIPYVVRTTSLQSCALSCILVLYQPVYFCFNSATVLFFLSWSLLIAYEECISGLSVATE
jgi:hypothetical protein